MYNLIFLFYGSSITSYKTNTYYKYTLYTYYFTFIKIFLSYLIFLPNLIFEEKVIRLNFIIFKLDQYTHDNILITVH